MIVPATLNLTAYRNGYFQGDITLTDNGQILDLTGFSAELQIRTFPGAPGAPFLSISTSSPTTNGSIITWINQALGKVRVYINEKDFLPFPPSPVSSISGATYAYDLLLTAPSSDPFPYIKGSFQLNEGVSVSP